jgi:hypothetical protein
MECPLSGEGAWTLGVSLGSTAVIPVPPLTFPIEMRPMMGLKSFWSAAVTLAGIELMRMIRKGQLKATGRCVRRTGSMHWPTDFHGWHRAVCFG